MPRSITNIDWLTVFLFLLLVGFGWVNIYSASLSESAQVFFDFGQVYAKQGLWIALSLVLIVIVLSIEASFYERFASVFYILSMISLAGLFVFGKKISGATSWYDLGFMNFQPTEFAKVATALALAKYISDIQTEMDRFKHHLKAFLIIAIPAVLILLQPDAGSALVYAAFFFPMYREGLSPYYFIVAISLIALFILTLLLGPVWVTLISVAATGLILLKNRRRRPNFLKWGLIAATAAIFVFSVDFIFHHVFEQRHRDRFNIVLGRKVDPRGIGYNTQQSEIALGAATGLGKAGRKARRPRGILSRNSIQTIFSVPLGKNGASSGAPLSSSFL